MRSTALSLEDVHRLDSCKNTQEAIAALGRPPDYSAQFKDPDGGVSYWLADGGSIWITFDERGGIVAANTVSEGYVQSLCRYFANRFGK
jgi:hypothetical protein